MPVPALLLPHPPLDLEAIDRRRRLDKLVRIESASLVETERTIS